MAHSRIYQPTSDNDPTISKLIGREEVTKAFRQTEQAQEGRSGEVARDTKEGQQMSVRV
jgi:hypothetical protein